MRAANLLVEEPYALMRARTDLWEPWRVIARATRPDVSIAIVHTHGHGGSGVTLSWCCAAEVPNLVAIAWRSAWTTLPRGPSPPDTSTSVARAFAVRAAGLARDYIEA